MTAPLYVSNSSGCKHESSARGSHKAALLAVIYTRYVNAAKQATAHPHNSAHTDIRGRLHPRFLALNALTDFYEIAFERLLPKTRNITLCSANKSESRTKLATVSFLLQPH
jgi:hypothetical protein